MDADLLFVPARLLECHYTVRKSEQGVIAAESYVFARQEYRTALSDKNVARNHRLAAITFHAQPLSITIATVS
jgi:hypothetical protein